MYQWNLCIGEMGIMVFAKEILFPEPVKSFNRIHATHKLYHTQDSVSHHNIAVQLYTAKITIP